jgi:hypothetical protein
MSDLIQNLISIVGKEHVAYSPADKLVYSHVAGRRRFYWGEPDVIVMPGSTAEVSRIMQVATRTRTPVVPGLPAISRRYQIPSKEGLWSTQAA